MRKHRFEVLKLFLFVFISLLIVGFFYQYFLDTGELLHSFYAENYVQEQIEEIIEQQQKWRWLGYVTIPLFILIRTNLVALCLSTVSFFYNTENELKFKQFLRIALLGEFVWILVGVVKFGYFYWYETDFSFLDFQQYYPLSFTNYLDLETLEPWLIYPLQTINLFEVLYFFVLVAGMHKLLKENYWKSFEKVAVGYGTGLVIWLGLVMFLTLNMS
jgi:hypothetical protein